MDIFFGTNTGSVRIRLGGCTFSIFSTLSKLCNRTINFIALEHVLHQSVLLCATCAKNAQNLKTVEFDLFDV